MGSFGNFAIKKRYLALWSTCLLWTLWTFPTYGFWGFWDEIRAKKRQKFAFICIFARFCITFSRFFTFLNVEKLWKLNSTKGEFPELGH